MGVEAKLERILRRPAPLQRHRMPLPSEPRLEILRSGRRVRLFRAADPRPEACYLLSTIAVRTSIGEGGGGGSRCRRQTVPLASHAGHGSGDASAGSSPNLRNNCGRIIAALALSLASRRASRRVIRPPV